MSSSTFIGFHLTNEPFGFLSNWWPCRFQLDGKVYTCSEQYMMEQKALLFGDTETAEKIMNEEDPAEMQRLGRNASGLVPVVWDAYKQLIVYKALKAKFSQNYDLRAKLLATGHARLAECSRSDKIWGIGMHAGDLGADDPVRWKGQNLLGFTLEAVWEELRKQ